MRTAAELYQGWSFANDALIAAVRTLSSEQVRLTTGAGDWPIWASASHVAGARVFWLCHVFGEPGAETTPFTDPNVGWEDDPSHPRSADELVHALGSTWRVVERCLATWTIGSLSQEARRARGDDVRIHTRQSVLVRLITHDAYHSGEIALTLGAHGLGQGSPNGPVDLWSRLARREA